METVVEDLHVYKISKNALHARPSVQHINNNSNGALIQIETQEKPAKIWMCGKWVYMMAGGPGGTSPIHSHVYRTPVLAGINGGSFDFPLVNGIETFCYLYANWERV